MGIEELFCSECNEALNPNDYLDDPDNGIYCGWTCWVEHTVMRRVEQAERRHDEMREGKTDV